MRCSDAVVGVSVEVETSGRARMHPGPERARRPTSAPDGSGPCCMHMYPEYMGVLHVRAHDGCAQRLARRWRLQLIQRPRQRAQRRRPKHVAHDAAAIARALRREPRAISVNRLEIIASSAFTFTHNLCDEFRVISHFYSRFRGEIECDGGDAVAVFSPLRATDAVAR